MHVRLMSDLHLEFNPDFEITPLPTDKESVLLLCGDICPVALRHIHMPFLKQASELFDTVIYVFGNHEYYSFGSLTQSRYYLQEYLAEEKISNVFVLENETLMYGDVAFIGATLWTDFQRQNFTKMQQARHYMADYKTAFVGEDWRRTLTPDDVYGYHVASKKYIAREAKEHKRLGHKTVVAVHHGVSELSVHERFKGHPANCFFVSELGNDILDWEPNIVCHGHVHNPFDYKIGDTRILVNPCGYPGETTGEFNPTLSFEI